MKPIPTETGTDVGSVGKWLGAAAAGALLMYLLDPERGSARRARAYSAVRSAGARTGATVGGALRSTGATVGDALHSAGDRLADLKDSAAGALSRGATRLQSQATPMLERVQHGAREEKERIEDRATRVRDRAGEYGWDEDRGYGRAYGRAYGKKYDEEYGRNHAAGSSRALAPAGSNSYEADHRYGAGHEERGGLSQWLRGLGGSGAGTPNTALLGGGMLGLLGLMRRSPGGLLVGLAALALLMRGTGTRRYMVGEFTGTMNTKAAAKAAGREHERDQDRDGSQSSYLPPAEQSGSKYLH